MNNAISHFSLHPLPRGHILSKGMWVLLMVLPVIMAIIIGWAATTNGPGINADGVNYINMATNIQAGRGFIADFVDTYSDLPYGPVTFWPPAYPLLVAGLMKLGLNAIEAARWISLLALGGLVCATFALSRYLGGRLCGLLAATVTASLMPVMRLGTFALSEGLFVLFSMLALLCAIQYMQSAKAYEWRWLLTCALCVGLAILTRYVGVLWLVGLGAVIVWKEVHRTANWLNVLIAIALVGVIAAAPVTPWLMRNWLLTGYLTGMDRDHKFHADLMGNLWFLVNTIAIDLLPPVHLGVRGLLTGLPTFVLMLVVLCLFIMGFMGAGWVFRRGIVHATFKSNRRGWLQWMCTPQALTIQFAALYLGGMLFLSTIMEFPLYDWPRTAAVIYPCLIALALSFLNSALKRLLNLRFLHRFVSLQAPMLVLVAALCIVPYALQTRGFVQEAAKGQEFTTAAWRENQALRAMAGIADTQSTLYSDRAPAVYLYLQRPVRYLPYRENMAEFYQFLERKQAHPDETEYVLTFKGALGSNDPYRPSRISYAEMLDLMADHSDIALLADLPDGAIFRIGSDIE
ncbi:MAG: glycosyltransferase family 39 protein [Caldilineaceae bacterium]